MANLGVMFGSYMTAQGRGRVPVWLGYILIAVAGLAFFQNGEFANEMVSFAARNHFDYQTSWQSSLFGFLGFIGGPAVGAWLWIKGKDLLPWNKILIAAILVEVACGVIITLTQNFTLLVPVRILQGAASSIMAGLGTAIVSAVFDRKTARRINSCLQPAVALGVAIGLNVPKLSESFHLDWPLIILSVTLLIGLAEWVTLRFIPDIRSLMQEARREAQQEAVQTQAAPAVFLIILVVYAGLGAAVQQIFVNGLFSYPEATLQSLGALNAQGVAGMGGNIAFLGAITGAIVASALSPKLHFPIAGGLAALTVAGIGYGFLVDPTFLTPSYYAFAFSYNLGVGTLAAPLAQDVQNTETRQTAAGIFILVQGLVSAGYAGLYLPLLAGAPAVLFFGSALAIAVVVAVMSIMYHNLTKGPVHTAAQQAPVPTQAEHIVHRLQGQLQKEQERLEETKGQLQKEQEQEQERHHLKIQLEEVQTEFQETLTELRAAQINRLEQQLKDDQHQLQEAKNNLEQAREHEQQLKRLKTRIGEVQAELQSTESRLEEAQASIDQY